MTEGQRMWNSLICATREFDIDSYTKDMDQMIVDYIQARGMKGNEIDWSKLSKSLFETMDGPKLIDTIFLYCALQSGGIPAQDLLETICEFLLNFRAFEHTRSSVMSGGMLNREGLGQSLQENQIVYDILMPNIYCVLLLEAKGQCKPANEATSLRQLRQNADEYLFKSYIELSRSLSKGFPDFLSSLFAITRGKKEEYQIATNYPDLFLAILSGINVSTLSTNVKVKNSLKHHLNFFDLCFRVISRNDAWMEDSFEEYYMFERIFRLNTKLTLSLAAHGTKDKNLILSPALLGHIFFSSPLVFFPENLLANMLYDHIKNPLLESDKSLNANVDTGATSFSHFLIQLSSFWFPNITSILRYYMHLHNITGYENVKRFLFPQQSDFQIFQSKFRPKPPNFEPWMLDRTLCDKYKTEWGIFSPSEDNYIDALVLRDIDTWKELPPSNQYSALDYCALRQIQDSLSL